jgi:hypothetical protein
MVYRRPSTVILGGALTFEALNLHDAGEEILVAEEVKHHSIEAYNSSAKRVECPPLSQWESLAPRGVPQKMRFAPKAIVNGIAVARSSTLELSRFQRFIRRMESAGPRIVLDRLQEEWQEPPGEEADEQVSLTRRPLPCTDRRGHSWHSRNNCGSLRGSECRRSAAHGSPQNHLVIRVRSWSCMAILVSQHCATG